MTERACTGVSPRVFFEDNWFQDGLTFTDALATARSYCDRCPNRNVCLRTELDFERGSAENHRFGIYGGMTPAQRHSMEKRGIVLDGTEDLAALARSIPDRGDQWTPRHTELAQDVMAWIVTTSAPDGPVPTAIKLARSMGVRVKDMRRVYAAFIEDRVLVESDGTFKRGPSAASARWTPPHLRV